MWRGYGDDWGDLVAARTPRKRRTGRSSDGSGAVPREPEGGPRSWLTPFLESSYSRIVPREQAPPDADRATLESSRVAAAIGRGRPARRRRDLEPAPLRSTLQPGLGDEVLHDVPRDFWLRRLREYQQRKFQVAEARLGRGPVGMPAVPGLNNWVPLGPAVAARGQAVGRPAIGGRTSRIAVIAGGARLYAATANGGVFRSDDGGSAWRSLMDGFDVDPLSFASTSLCCGAVAVSASDPDRVYVGTGEGDTDALFTLRLTNALPAYRGSAPSAATTAAPPGSPRRPRRRWRASPSTSWPSTRPSRTTWSAPPRAACTSGSPPPAASACSAAGPAPTPRWWRPRRRA